MEFGNTDPSTELTLNFLNLRNKIVPTAAQLENYAIFDTSTNFVGILTFQGWSFPDIVPS